MIPPIQRVPIEGTLITPGIGNIHETEQAALQPGQPISQGSHIDTMSHAVQKDLPTTQNVFGSLWKDQLYLRKEND